MQSDLGEPLLFKGTDFSAPDIDIVAPQPSHGFRDAQ